MRRLAIVFGLGPLMSACAIDDRSINGTWTAILSSSNGAKTFDFTTSLAAIGNNGLNVAYLTFNSQGECFPGSSTASGSFVASGDFNGNASGGIQLTVNSATGENQLKLNGTLHNNTVSGTWTLTGGTSGCTGSGTFIMNKG
jgi:hypothetical protein